MSDYIVSLALLYFKERGTRYSWPELRSLLGLTSDQLDDLVQHLIENGYLVYQEYELRISESGLKHLILANQFDYKLTNTNNNYYLETLELKRPAPFDRPYVPKGFDKKYKTSGNRK